MLDLHGSFETASPGLDEVDGGKDIQYVLWDRWLWNRHWLRRKDGVTTRQPELGGGCEPLIFDFVVNRARESSTLKRIHDALGAGARPLYLAR